jgi:hypothetical protein
MATILAKQTRQPGTIDSGNTPVSNVSANTNYILTALMDAVDIADATLTIGFKLFLDTQLVRDETWTCGAKDKNGNFVPPIFSYSTGSILPTTFRAVITLPRRISFGLDLTTSLVVP